MKSERKLGLIGKFAGSLSLIVSMSGCTYFPADGINSRGGLLYPCVTKECKLNNDFFETLRHMTPYETILANMPDKDGNCGEMPSYSCNNCYPPRNK